MTIPKNGLRIGIIASRMLISQRAGVENYTYNLINALAKIDSQNIYTIYFRETPELSFFSTLTNNNANFHFKVLSSPVLWTQLRLLLELLKNPVDVIFSAEHTLPGLVMPFIKSVIMIHGLEYRLDNNKFPKRFMFDAELSFYTRFSSAVITPSQFVKDGILNSKWVKEEDKIHVIKEGVSENFYKRGFDGINSVKHKYGILNDDYILFVSTIQPRKNIPKLIEAFSFVLKDLGNPSNLKLVISGKMGWDYKESIEAPKRFGVSDRVLFIGRSSDEELPGLLSGSKIFISASFEEGFGLPLLEAMTCQIPCVVSDIKAYHEVSGNYPTYVDPNDVSSIKNGILLSLERGVSEEKQKEALKITKSLTWDQTAKQTLSIIQSLFKNS